MGFLKEKTFAFHICNGSRVIKRWTMWQSGRKNSGVAEAVFPPDSYCAGLIDPFEATDCMQSCILEQINDFFSLPFPAIDGETPLLGWEVNVHHANPSAAQPSRFNFVRFNNVCR